MQPNAFNALAPAWARMKQMLFQPFSVERWLALGVLCFVQTCAGLGAPSGCGSGNFNVPSDLEDLPGWGTWDREHSALPPRAPSASEVVFASLAGDAGAADDALSGDFDFGELSHDLAEATDWLRAHLGLVLAIGAASLLLGLGVAILFLWLGARGAFAYVDNVAKNRADIVAPWNEHASLADSFWRWRLVLAAAVWILLLAILIPGSLIVYRAVSAAAGDVALTLLKSVPLWSLAAAVVIVGIAALLVDITLYDVALPIQYLRRGSTSEAMREAVDLVGSQLGAFLVYLFLKILLAIGITVVVALFGLVTCCCGFVLLIVPVVGQAILQPVWVLHRSLSLYFLQQCGPKYDVFATPAPAPAASSA